MKTLLPFTVIAFDNESHHLVALKVMAEESLHAFAVAAHERKTANYGFITALKGHQDEDSGYAFPGEGVVYTETILEQTDVFGTADAGTGESRVVFIHVERTVPFATLAEEDKEVAGVYAIDMASSVHEESIANAAMDGFHARLAIKALDHFSISVRSSEHSESAQIPEGEAAVQGELSREVLSIMKLPPAPKKQGFKP